uniref:Multiple epidermal growth factor-like domains protein 6 n=1 Tax=Crassostrea virginica TaxID=6565 RepID=A0A8B8C271_CRAVI|nr:multiple epidermal growth factor-like domains protein 6 [Crassostrea virginica]
MKNALLFLVVFVICRNSYGYVNLALNKHATITSRAHFWSRPELANDGNDGQDDAECTQTIHNVTEAWWQVDLIGASILSVHITYAQNSADTMAGFSVYVSDERNNFKGGHLCFHHNADTLPAQIGEFECKVHGRYLTFYNERLPNVQYPDLYSSSAVIQLCEVNILGCERYDGGFSCLPCSSLCKNSECDISTTKCLHCYEGYRGTDCTQACRNSTYGINCSRQCGHCANDVICDHVNGTCADGCQAGWRAPFCNTSCPTGSFGMNCGGLCSDKCKTPGQCDPVTGHCVGGCVGGWKGDFCNQLTEPSGVAMEEESYLVEIVIGVVVGIIILIIAVIVIVIFVRYIQRSDSRSIAHQKK